MVDKVFNAETEVSHIVAEIRKYFANNGGPDTKAVIGISGGKDSTIAAALLVRALGKDRVVGVMMPNGEQSDIDDSIRVCNILDIENIYVNIEDAILGLYFAIGNNCANNNVVATNTPARIRMTTLYAIAGLVGGRVINTGNCSELYVGYTTKYGDLAGDYAILRDYYVSEVYQLGDALKELPHDLVHKTPADGMSGKTDEDNMGFTYEELDAYLMKGIAPSAQALYEINLRHKRNTHKNYIDMPHPAAITRPYNKRHGGCWEKPLDTPVGDEWSF